MKKLSILVFALLISNISFSQVTTKTIKSTRNYDVATAFDKAPYLLYTGSNTEMLLVWQLMQVDTCKIEWGLFKSSENKILKTLEYNNSHQHKLLFSKLKPGTKYFYRVICKYETKSGSFITGPSSKTSKLCFYTYGDTRTFPKDHDAVAKTILNEIKKDPKSQSLVMMNGDFVQKGNEELSWTNEFFDPQYSNIQTILATVPYVATLGNHEGQGLLFGKYFPYPQYISSRYYYSFDYGSVHFTVIDQFTNYAPGSTQYTWLENDLKNSTKKWKFILNHEPAWTAYPLKGGHANNKEAQNILQPLCLKYGVSFVFSGHNHFYSRANVNNVMHVTTGGGGAPLYPPGADRENIVIADKSNHFCKIDIKRNTLKLTAIRSDGSIIETINYKPSKKNQY